MQGTADFHYDIPDALLPQADAVFDDATALDTAVDMLDPQSTGVGWLFAAPVAVGGFLVGMRISTCGSVKAMKPRSCNSRLPAGKGYGVAEEQDDQHGIDQQDVLYRMVLFLATVTLLLFSRVVGADKARVRPVMIKRGVCDGPSSGA